jgi:RNA 2',3'-cyclic 3'-phosphodiesterase
VSRMRTFIAVELSDAICSRLTKLQESLGETGADVKWVEAENLHVTLLFLGEVDERDLKDVCAAVSAACAGVESFVLSVEGVGSFGPPRRPRTVWAAIKHGHDELVALHDAIEPPLLDLGCYRREERRFEPHVTLGRVRGDVEGLPAALLKQQRFVAGECEVGEVAVMSSELRAEGPVYAMLSRGKLR